MKAISTIAATLVATAGLCAASARPASAQAPCSIKTATADSARDEVMTVLSSQGQLAQEIRQEQHLGQVNKLHIDLVKNGWICSKLATQFGHPIGVGTNFVALHVGPLFYAREPDQTRGTGILTDSAFHVIARLGVSDWATQSGGTKNP